MFQTSAQNACTRRDSSETRSPVFVDYYRINATSINTAMYYLMNTLPYTSGPHVFSVLLRTAIDTIVTLRVNNFDGTNVQKSFEIKANEWSRLFIPADAPVYSWGFKVAAKTTIDVAHWQMEAGSEMSSPIHGLMGEGYKWLEYPHNSSSIRSKTVLNGGITRYFNNYGIILTDITGIGINSLEVNATSLINQYTRLLDSIGTTDRTIKLGYHMYARTFEQLVRYHSELSQNIINLESPKTFIFSHNCYNINPVQFTGVLTEGLEFELNNFHAEELGLEIELLSPLFSKEPVFYSINGAYT
ncbi:MAG: hypothetical protein KC414_03500, partial [Romboutsia sp.]|nr:hypothetical protein [Romboutsia sp.]